MNRFCFAILLCVSIRLTAQTKEPGTDELLKQKLESISENLASDDVDFTTLEEQLLNYKEHPLNINTATSEQLQQLLILNGIQINNLLNYTRSNGPLLQTQELQAIDGFDLQTIQSLLPYIKVSDEPLTLNEALNNGKSTMLFRYQRVLEQQKGYTVPANGTGSSYLGSPDKFYTRCRYNSTKVMAGITAEKDPGEQFFNTTQKQGFDFYSAHVVLKDIGKIKTLALGDYQLQFGQGLIAWSGLAFNKTSDAIAIKRNAIGIRAHTSVDENLFYRGAAATVHLKNFYVTGYVSRKRIDANISDTLSSGEASAVSALQVTGEHATLSELADKHSIQQTIMGGDVSYKINKLNVGVTTMYTNLSAALKRDVKMYNQYQ